MRQNVALEAARRHARNAETKRKAKKLREIERNRETKQKIAELKDLGTLTQLKQKIESIHTRAQEEFRDCRSVSSSEPESFYLGSLHEDKEHETVIEMKISTLKARKSRNTRTI